MAHLLVVGLGPVQDFITAARRSRDLWFGSWLLSELARAAAGALATPESGATLIFPDPAALAPGNTASIANKVLAVVPGDPQKVAVVVKDAVYARLRELRDDAFGHIIRRGAPYYDVDARDQVDDLPEFYWVALPLADDPAAYRPTRARLEALLASRKTARTFSPASWAAARPKSSLDGAREAVIPEGRYPAPGDPADVVTGKQEALFRDYGAGPAERLSGVDLLKRLGVGTRPGAGTIRFPSTSAIAARPYLARLETLAPAAQTRLQTFWMQFIDALPERVTEPEKQDEGKIHRVLGVYHGGLLYESRLDEQEIPAVQLALARTKLRDFYNEADRLMRDVDNEGRPGPARPTPYYALLAADGDRMGATIDRLAAIPAHQALSRALAGFAAGVRAIVEQDHDGALVYAGGDDVLAFLPVHRAVLCARALADAFATAMRAALPPPAPDQPSIDAPTLSAGVVIMHHLEPLTEVRKLARGAEDAAKADGRNALAVTLAKRGGVPTTVVGSWAGAWPLDARLGTFAAWHRDEAIPDGAAYELRDLAARLAVSADSPLAADLRAALPYEVGRVLQRKRGARGRARLDKAQIAQLQTHLAAGAALRVPPTAPLDALAAELIVARELAATTALAAG